MRIDILLADKKVVQSRQKAKNLIENKQVFVNDKLVLKPSQLCCIDDKIDIHGEMPKYVGRGGLKLEKALEAFNIDVNNSVAIDIGASTGGFTHCLLLNGANKVFAIDVGTAQLDDFLREDNRVVVMENTNICDVTVEMLNCDIDLAVCDLSFVSLGVIFPYVFQLLNNNSQFIALIKPQFEAGKGVVAKNGVVKSPKIHEAVLHKVVDCVKLYDFTCLDITHSPIKGGKGNIEYLALIKKGVHSSEINIELTVMHAHKVVR